MKKLLSLLLIGIFALALTGCVDIEDPDEEVDCELYPTHIDCLGDIDVDSPDAPGIINVLDTLPNEDITVTFWHVYGSEKELLLGEFITEFEELYPNITIDAANQGGYDDIRSNTILAIRNGVTPTMLIGYPDHIAGYLNGSAVIPLDDFIKSDIWGIDIDDFVKSFVEENNQYAGGLMYSLPYSKSTEMMIFNEDKFLANGITVPIDRYLSFEELEDYAEVMVGDGPNQCEYLLNYDSAANFFINSVRQWDGGYTNSNGDILVDNQNTRDMLQYIQDLFANKTLTLPLAWEADYGSDNFIAGDVCMTVGSTAGVSYNVGDQEWDWAVAPVPQYDEDHLSAVQQGPNVAIMSNSTDAERLAAWLFITFITDAEHTARWSMLTGYLPVSYSGYNSVLFQEFLNDTSTEFDYSDFLPERLAITAAFLQTEYFRYDPAFAGSVTSSGARLQAGIVMEAIYSGSRVTPYSITVDEAIADMLVQLGAND